MKTLRRLVRDPLAHFIGAGALLFLLYAGTVDPPEVVDSDRVVTVSRGTVNWMSTSWKSKSSREPTAEELKGLIDNYVRETIYYREALAMGLDDDDTIIRRRLAQKLEFLTQDIAQLAVASEEELKAYMGKSREKYETPAKITITHIYFSPDKRKGTAADDARAVLAKLENTGTDGAAELGDQFMLQRYYPEKSATELSREFGHAFGNAVLELEPASWHGPVESGYGSHLVYVHSRTDASMPEWDQIREKVKEDWLGAKREEISDRYYANLRERYEVVVVEEEE